MTSPDKPQCPTCGHNAPCHQLGHCIGNRNLCDCTEQFHEALPSHQGDGGQAEAMPTNFMQRADIPNKPTTETTISKPGGDYIATPPTSFTAEVWELLCGQKLHMEPGKSPVIVDTEKTLAAITRAVEKHVIGEDDPKPILEDDPDAAAGVLTATGLRNAIRSSQFDWRAYAERTNLKAQQRRHLHE